MDMPRAQLPEVRKQIKDDDLWERLAIQGGLHNKPTEELETLRVNRERIPESYSVHIWDPDQRFQ